MASRMYLKRGSGLSNDQVQELFIRLAVAYGVWPSDIERMLVKSGVKVINGYNYAEVLQMARQKMAESIKEKKTKT